MKKTIILSILVLFSARVCSQLTIKNNTKNPISNLYIIEYDSILKNPYCSQILNENLISKKLPAGRSLNLKYKLKPSTYYNLISFNATTPFYYQNVCFKYFISNKTKIVSIDIKDIEVDFAECDMETDTQKGFTSIKFDFKNNTSSRIIKGYYKLSENDEYKRYSYFQLEPLFSGFNKIVKTSNYISVNSTKIYFKFYFEKNGIISTKDYETNIENVYNLNKFIID